MGTYFAQNYQVSEDIHNVEFPLPCIDVLSRIDWHQSRLKFLLIVHKKVKAIKHKQ